MIEFLKQTLLSTMGLASLTKEKAQQLAAEMGRLGNLSEQEKLKLQHDLAARGEEAQQALIAEIDRRIDHAFIQLGIIKAGVKKTEQQTVSNLRTTADAGIDEVLTRLKVARLEDIEALASRLDLLEKKLAQH